MIEEGLKNTETTEKGASIQVQSRVAYLGHGVSSSCLKKQGISESQKRCYSI